MRRMTKKFLIRANSKLLNKMLTLHGNYTTRSLNLLFFSSLSSFAACLQTVGFVFMLRVMIEYKTCMFVDKGRDTLIYFSAYFFFNF